MKKNNLFKIFILTFFITFNSPVSAIIPSTIKSFPQIPYVMSDCHNGDWGKTHPEWGPVGGWWGWKEGHCNDGGNTPEEYLRKAKQMKVTLDDGRVIPKPVGIGIPFTLNNIGEWKNRLNNSEFNNLAFLVAESPSVYGEVTNSYCKGGVCVEDTTGWAGQIMEPLSRAFPNIPIFFQGGVNTLIGLCNQAVSLPNKNIAIKANGWTVDLDNALRTIGGVLKGGEMGFTTVYHNRLAVGFEPGVAGTGNSIEDPKHWYWGVMEALSHHPDFFDIQEPVLSVMASVQNQYHFPLLKFLRDHLSKTIDNTPDLWTVLRTSQVTEVCWCGTDLTDCMAPDCCYTPSDGGDRICTGPQRTNFSYFLYQKDNLSDGRTVAFTVKGSSLVPSAAQSHAYGYHTARRTDQANGQNFMYFDVDDSYRQPQNKQGWEVTVTFVNKGNDKLSLEYNNKSNQIIKKTISKGSALGPINNWIDYKWTLFDADFTGNKMNGADFRINAEGDGDEIIHRVIIKPISLPATPTPTKQTTTLSPTTNPTTISDQAAYFPGWQKINLTLETKIPQNCQIITFKEESSWQSFLSFLNNLSFAPKKRQVWLKCN